MAKDPVYHSKKNYTFKGKELSLEILIQSYRKPDPRTDFFGKEVDGFMPLANADEAKEMADALTALGIQSKRNPTASEDQRTDEEAGKYGIYLTPSDLFTLIYQINAPFKAVEAANTLEDEQARDYITSIAKKVYVDEEARNIARQYNDYDKYEYAKDWPHNLSEHYSTIYQTYQTKAAEKFKNEKLQQSLPPSEISCSDYSAASHEAAPVLAHSQSDQPHESELFGQSD